MAGNDKGLVLKTNTGNLNLVNPVEKKTNIAVDKIVEKSNTVFTGRNLLLAGITTTVLTVMALGSTGCTKNENIVNNYSYNEDTTKVDTKGYFALSSVKRLAIGDSFTTVAGVGVRLADISVAVGTANLHPAIVDILDANNEVVDQASIAPNKGYTFKMNGVEYMLVCKETAAGITLNSKWAKLQLFEKE